MPAIKVTLTPELAAVLEAEANAAGTTKTAILAAAAATLAAGGAPAKAIRRNIAPSNHGGPRPGAGRPPKNTTSN